MRKRELEKLLFRAVADALGVELNAPREAAKSAPKDVGQSHEHREAA